MKQRKVRKTQKESTQAQRGTIPIELQQSLINIFKNAFDATFTASLQPTLQEVKQHLYNRDFQAAFGKDDYLRAYAVRWSPSRALAYWSLLSDIQNQLAASKDGIYRALCLGGGAGAEVVALAAFFDRGLKGNVGSATTSKLSVTALDIANWTAVLRELEYTLRAIPPDFVSSQGAEQASEGAGEARDDFTVAFKQTDLLEISPEDLSLAVETCNLVTLMFTLNELYSTSMAKTTKVLLSLSEFIPLGAFLLVVDSPGSYSTVKVGSTEKTYPMKWLLEHTLMETFGNGADSSRRWNRILSDDSRWFRLPEGLRYPIGLENMRYQVHLFQMLRP
ncbi:MAG: hypothetical protein M1824_001916 [Vezdaea acicularis]|nr:MAG: hypothetical protein M1824_001916 [Vezdaea acicularis]